MPIFLWGLLPWARPRRMSFVEFDFSAAALETRSMLYLSGTRDFACECMPTHDSRTTPGTPFPFPETTGSGKNLLFTNSAV